MQTLMPLSPLMSLRQRLMTEMALVFCCGDEPTDQLNMGPVRLLSALLTTAVQAHLWHKTEDV